MSISWLPNPNDNSSTLKCFRKIVCGWNLCDYVPMSRAVYHLRDWSVWILLQHQKYQAASADSMIRFSQDMKNFPRFLLLMIRQLSSQPEEIYTKTVVKNWSWLPREVGGVCQACQWHWTMLLRTCFIIWSVMNWSLVLQVLSTETVYSIVFYSKWYKYF